MVLTGRDATSIGGGLELEEVQADDAMGRFSLLPWWKTGEEGIKVMRHVLLVLSRCSYASCWLVLRLRPQRHSSLPNIVEQLGAVLFKATALFVMFIGAAVCCIMEHGWSDLVA